jgi:hypothetical protein
VRATGIGCFFDDLMRQVFGFADGMAAWQSLYHSRSAGQSKTPGSAPPRLTLA